jgi:hypothetical protein
MYFVLISPKASYQTTTASYCGKHENTGDHNRSRKSSRKRTSPCLYRW